MNVRNYIPNALTCLNTVSGCIACVMALSGELSGAVAWIVVASVFDFFDGFAARWLKAYSPIGKDLDSLADMVSFGVAPGMVVFRLLTETAPVLPLGEVNAFIPYIAFVIPVFSGLRLARFNHDERQTTSFIGLPVPAHALFWAPVGYAVAPVTGGHEAAFACITVVLSVCTSLLLVSETPMFSLKMKSWGWKGNELRYVLAGCAVVLVALWGLAGISVTILLYLVLSVVFYR
jgi:CDP-diacylglycerol--serine O-phosphatidyltransferase